jgi:hypothetical protein
MMALEKSTALYVYMAFFSFLEEKLEPLSRPFL